MGFRFHRSISFGKHFRVNLSKSGVSESVGTRGAWFTIGPRGTRTTVGIPGTGLSYSQQSHHATEEAPQEQNDGTPRTSSGYAWLWLLVAAVGSVVAIRVFG